MHQNKDMRRLQRALLTITNPTHNNSHSITKRTKKVHSEEARSVMIHLDSCMPMITILRLFKLRKIILGQSPPSPRWQKSISQPTAHSSEKIKIKTSEGKSTKLPKSRRIPCTVEGQACWNKCETLVTSCPYPLPAKCSNNIPLNSILLPFQCRTPEPLWTIAPHKFSKTSNRDPEMVRWFFGHTHTQLTCMCRTQTGEVLTVSHCPSP